MSSLPQFREYTDDYKLKTKTEWYSAGRPTSPDLRKILLSKDVKDEVGRIPAVSALNKWRDQQLWDIWADELDSRALTLVEDDLIIKKAEMLKRHATMAEELQLEGMTYLKENKFDTSASAVTAIIKGAELERESRGVGEMMVKMAKMGNNELVQEILRLSARAGDNEQIIDSEEVPEEKDNDSE